MQPVAVLTRLAWMRLLRGRTKWLSGLLALMPPAFAALLVGGGDETPAEAWEIVGFFAMQLPALLAIAVHLAPAVGDELESRTYTYLWSRPMRRRAVLYGKLLATAPPIAALFLLSVVGTWAVIWQGDAGAHLEELARALLATLGVVSAGAMLALATSSLLPRRPLAFVLGYVLLGEQLMGFVPLLQKVSISFHAASISGTHPPELVVGTLADGVLGLVVLSVVWLGVAVWRVESAEYALPDG